MNRSEQDMEKMEKLIRVGNPKLPAMYATQVAGQQNLEPMYATTDEEAVRTAKQRVCAGQLKVIYIFKLMAAEVYEPSSRSISVEEMQAFQPVAAPEPEPWNEPDEAPDYHEVE